MLRLHGFPLSNYTNAVKTALLEKRIEFETVPVPPSQDEDYLAKSPMGKVPCIETEFGYLSETHAILDYLEERYPTPPLLPEDPFARAKVRELVQALGLYVELVARKGIAAAFGREVPDHVKAGMKRDLPKGVAAIGRLAAFSPWIAGDRFTYADLFGYYTFLLGNMLSKTNTGIDLFNTLPGAEAWFARVGKREAVRTADAEMAEARKARGGKG